MLAVDTCQSLGRGHAVSGIALLLSVFAGGKTSVLQLWTRLVAPQTIDAQKKVWAGYEASYCTFAEALRHGLPQLRCHGFSRMLRRLLPPRKSQPSRITVAINKASTWASAWASPDLQQGATGEASVVRLLLRTNRHVASFPR